MRTKRDPIKLQVGDEVEWGSQAGGYLTKKRGKVLAVIPPDTQLYNVLEDLVTCSICDKSYPYDIHAVDNRMVSRKEESYLIEVPGRTEKCKPRLYWPLVLNLQKVIDDQTPANNPVNEAQTDVQRGAVSQHDPDDEQGERGSPDPATGGGQVQTP